jgi:hypothetical protein
LRGRSNNLVPPLTTTKSMTANDAASKTLKKGFLFHFYIIGTIITPPALME